MKRFVVCCFVLAIGSALVVLASPAASAPAAPAAMTHTTIAPGDLAWGPAPPILLPGAKIAPLLGDPSKEGTFILRIWMPANYKISPHWHPTTESITVLKGGFFLGDGDTFDKSKAKEIPLDGFGSLPPMHHHFAYTEVETIIDLVAYGPLQLYYVNPADDPSKGAATMH